ncbi:uncharacterized protein LOC142358533 [Convolutriloba macropyga]|uniref:uncharacterized protein LOC142358533 n=1 Tax=Convolutriloba macropyga TaxID=536237 RepID=UPI003F51D975
MRRAGSATAQKSANPKTAKPSATVQASSSRAKPSARAPGSKLPTQPFSKPPTSAAATPTKPRASADPPCSLRSVYGSKKGGAVGATAAVSSKSGSQALITYVQPSPTPKVASTPASRIAGKQTKKTTAAPPKSRGAPRCAYVSTSAASGQTPAKVAHPPSLSHTAKTPSATQERTAAPPHMIPRLQQKPIPRQPASGEPQGKSNEAAEAKDSPVTPKSWTAISAGAFTVAESVDPTPMKAAPQQVVPTAPQPAGPPEDSEVQKLLRSSVVRAPSQSWEDASEPTKSLRSHFMGRLAGPGQGPINHPPFGLLLAHGAAEGMVEPLASELNAVFLHISADVVGGSGSMSNGFEREIQDAAFTKAMDAPRAVVLVSYLNQQPKGKAARDARVQLLSDLCLYLDACAARPDQTIVVIVATNRPETLSTELLENLPHRFLFQVASRFLPPC